MSHMVGGSANVRLELAEDVHGDFFSVLFHCHGITPRSAGVARVGRMRRLFPLFLFQTSSPAP